MAIQYEGGNKKTSTSQAYDDYIKSRQKSEAAARAQGNTTGYTAGGSGAGRVTTSPSVSNPNTGRDTEYIPASSGSSRDRTDYAQLIRDAIQAQQDAEAERIRAQVEQGVNTLNAQRPELEKSYQDAAQQAYVQNMMSKKNLPQALAAQGLGGGVHESSYLDLENTYGNNLNLLRDSRDTALGGIDRDIANLRTSGDLTLADNSSRYAQMMLEAELQAKAEQLAAQNKYLSAGSASSTGRQLTYAQALELAKQTGFSDPAANQVLTAYGVDVSGLKNSYSEDIPQPTVAAPTFETKNEQLAYALLLSVQQGKMTAEQAKAIAARQGFELRNL